MKKSLKPMNFSKQLWVMAALGAMTFTSCETEESTTEESLTTQEVITEPELNYSDESDQIAEEVASIAEDVYATEEITAISKGSYRSDFLPDCVTITTVSTDTTREKTIDFGAGCELPNGNVLSGIIVMSYAIDMELAEKTITLALEDFTFNGVVVAGGANASFNATWPDGETASFNGTRTREWIEGYGSGFWGDNVFLITGNRTFVNRAGNTFEKVVTVPLRRELSCRFIVSGVLEITRNANTANLDFGDGSCDAKGTLTYPDGSSDEVFLRRFLK